MPVHNKAEQIAREVHVHVWTNAANLSEERCACGKIKISPLELERRTAEWNNYYDLVKTTPSGQDLQAMKVLFYASQERPLNETELMEVQAIKQRIKERNKVVIDQFGETMVLKQPQLSKPGFPDPVTWGHYVIMSDEEETLKLFDN